MASRIIHAEAVGPRTLRVVAGPEFEPGSRPMLREVTESELRSERQLRYWFGVVIEKVRALWRRERGHEYLPLQVHSVLMAEFSDIPAIESVNTPLGPSYATYPSSKFKSRAEFAAITDRVRQWVADTYKDERGNPERIPAPNESEYYE